MSHRKSEDLMFLIGGTLLGAAAMYVMDPQAGEKRRRVIADAAESAYGQARGAVADTLHRVADHAGDHVGPLTAKAQDIAADLASRAKQSLPDAGNAAADAGNSWLRRAIQMHKQARGAVADQAQDAHDQAVGHVSAAKSWAADQLDSARSWATDRASGARDWADRQTGDTRRRVGHWIAGEDSSGVGAGTVLSSTIGCLGVGAGLMYFLDPQKGRSRRAWAADKTASCINKTGKVIRSTAHHWANRARGIAHDTSSAAVDYAQQARIDSEQLVQRIREQVGQLSERLGNVQFMADASGAVTVTGNIIREEVDQLLTLLHKVPGVSHVINRLNVTEPSQSQTAQ